MQKLTAYSLSAHRAAWMGDTDAIQAYLDAGGCPHIVDEQGRTPLIFAAGYGRKAAVQLLLNSGASIGAPAGCASPLHR